MNLLYNKNTIIGRLYNYFSVYFEIFSLPTAQNLFLLVLSMLALESARSIRFLYRHFLSSFTNKSLNAFYYICSYTKVNYFRFLSVTASLALKIIPETLSSQPVFLCVDDTMAGKYGHKFEHISSLFDHAAHNSSNYLNGHCFVSLMLCVPVWRNDKVCYQPVPLGYRMWKKERSKLLLAAEMIHQVMPALSGRKNVILLCDSWYAKTDLVCLVDCYDNLDVICNVRCDSALYDLPPERTGKRGRPAKRGRRLSLKEDFPLTAKKTGDFYLSCRTVLTNIFKDRKVLAYVTCPDRESGSLRLFFSTVSFYDLQILCAWQEKSPLSQTTSSNAVYIPLFLYMFRWNIEVSYYEQKTFWSLCSYMVRSSKGIELFINLINTAYSSMKILPYIDRDFKDYKNMSTQEFRFVISRQIWEQVFIADLLNSTENIKKSEVLFKLLKQRLFKKSA